VAAEVFVAAADADVDDELHPTNPTLATTNRVAASVEELRRRPSLKPGSVVFRSAGIDRTPFAQ
jgi:hypothetical protein